MAAKTVAHTRINGYFTDHYGARWEVLVDAPLTYKPSRWLDGSSHCIVSQVIGGLCSMAGLGKEVAR